MLIRNRQDIPPSGRLRKRTVTLESKREMTDMATNEFWRLDRVKRETGLATTSIYEAMAKGLFPRNFPISKQARAWASDEVEAWKAARRAERDTAGQTVAA